MINYDNPAKNAVRSSWFSTIDQHFPPPSPPLTGIYLPGQHNLEGPLYQTRGIATCPVERSAQIRKAMCNPRKSTHPLSLKDVFLGSLREYVAYHIRLHRPRVDLIFADFEGKVHTIAPEIPAFFHIFPARERGLLGATYFAKLDHETIQEGIVMANAFNAMLDHRIFPQLDDLYDQLKPYIREHTHQGRVLCHAQFCREFGLMWRILLGMTLVTQPAQGPGKLNGKLCIDLTRILGSMHKEASRIEPLSTVQSFFHVPDYGLQDLSHQAESLLYPVSLKRLFYKSRDRNRMCTWFLSFTRLSHPIKLYKAAEQLWALYRRSALTFVLPDGNVQMYNP